MRYLLTIITIFISISIHAQQLAVKTDAVWDAMLMPNLGFDVVVGNRTTLGVAAFASPKVFNKDIKAYAVQPEYRYYFSGRAMHQHYIGVGSLALFYRQKKENYYQSVYTGGLGLLFGYVLHLGHRWNVDFHAGCGLYAFHKKKSVFDEPNDSWNKDTSHGLFAAPTSLGVSFNYVLK